MGRATSVNMSYLEFTTATWYRAPEGFFHSLGYSGAVDVWSVGCILAELITGQVFIQGKDGMNYKTVSNIE
jgi:serine/threonine protein kinase